jgi:hypothetical protein
MESFRISLTNNLTLANSLSKDVNGQTYSRC